MEEKLITLTDGTRMAVKVNFATIYYMSKTNIEKMTRKKNLTEREEIEVAANMIYVILRSNGMKVDKDEAMILVPLDTTEIKTLFEEFGERLEKFKKKQEAKQTMNQMGK